MSLIAKLKELGSSKNGQRSDRYRAIVEKLSAALSTHEEELATLQRELKASFFEPGTRSSEEVKADIDAVKSQIDDAEMAKAEASERLTNAVEAERLKTEYEAIEQGRRAAEEVAAGYLELMTIEADFVRRRSKIFDELEPKLAAAEAARTLAANTRPELNFPHPNRLMAERASGPWTVPSRNQPIILSLDRANQILHASEKGTKS